MDSYVNDLEVLSNIPASNILSITILAAIGLLFYVAYILKSDGTEGLTNAIESLGSVIEHSQKQQAIFQQEFQKITVSVQQITVILQEVKGMQEDISSIRDETTQTRKAFEEFRSRLFNIEQQLNSMIKEDNNVS